MDQLTRTWDDFGREDPLWAVLSNKDKRGNRWDVDQFFETGRREIGEVLAQTESIRPGLPRRRALDFGSGVGRLSQALCDHFEQVDGVDIASSMVEKARELNRFGERCAYHLNLRPDLSLFPDGRFDLIYSSVVLQHMSPDLAAGYLREFARLLSPQGLLVFQLPAQKVRKGLSRKPVFRQLSDGAYGLLRCAYLFWHRTLRRRPIMDMFATPPAKVKAILEAEGCRVLHYADDGGRAGPDWLSYLYWVVKA